MPKLYHTEKQILLAFDRIKAIIECQAKLEPKLEARIMHLIDTEREALHRTIERRITNWRAFGHPRRTPVSLKITRKKTNV